jgi:hypothetical protein
MTFISATLAIAEYLKNTCMLNLLADACKNIFIVQKLNIMFFKDRYLVCFIINLSLCPGGFSNSNTHLYITACVILYFLTKSTAISMEAKTIKTNFYVKRI